MAERDFAAVILSAAGYEVKEGQLVRMPHPGFSAGSAARVPKAGFMQVRVLRLLWREVTGRSLELKGTVIMAIAIPELNELFGNQRHTLATRTEPTVPE